MFDHVAHSFIATLQFEENPINTLDSMTTGPVVLTSLKGGPVHSIEGAFTLAVLDGSDEDWRHSKEIGLITFDKGAQPEPLKLYFRHGDSGYRIYVRSGDHFGEGVFVTDEGLVNVQPIEDKDPTLWVVTDAQTDEAFDLTQSEDNQREIQLVTDNGGALTLHNLYPVGGFLTIYDGAPHDTLSLLIEARGVDWLKP